MSNLCISPVCFAVRDLSDPVINWRSRSGSKWTKLVLIRKCQHIKIKALLREDPAFSETRVIHRHKIQLRAKWQDHHSTSSPQGRHTFQSYSGRPLQHGLVPKPLAYKILSWSSYTLHKYLPIHWNRNIFQKAGECCTPLTISIGVSFCDPL